MFFGNRRIVAMSAGLLGAVLIALFGCGSQESSGGWVTNPPESCSSDGECAEQVRCDSDGQCVSGDSERRNRTEATDRTTNPATNLAYAGLTNPADACSGTNGEMRLRFALARDGDSGVQGAEPVQQLNRSNVALENTVFFGDETRTCGSRGDCRAENFTCRAPQIAEGSGAKRCIKGADLEVEKVTRNTRSADHFFGVVMENSGSLQGWTANLAATDKYYDYCTEENGTCRCEQQDVPCRPDGITDTPPVASQQRLTATDFNLYRITALKRMEPNLSRAARLLDERGHEFFFGLWSFSNETSLNEYIPSGTGWSNKINESPTLFEEAVQEFETDAGTVNQTRANVYEATKQVIETSYTDENIQGIVSDSDTSFEKSLVLVVDGPDDLRNSDDTTIDELISVAEDVDVSVFVYQVDPTMSDRRVLRDDPAYYRRQTPCQSSSECKNFETCRKPGRYGPENASVQEPQIPSEDAKFCLPERGPDGRLGPIADLAKLGCATGGGYKYLTNLDSQSRHQAVPKLQQLSKLPYTAVGSWQATVTSSQLNSDVVPTGQFLPVGGRVSVTTGDASQTYTFSPNSVDDSGGPRGFLRSD